MSKARKTAASSGEPDFWRVARDWLHHWLPKVRGSSPKTVEAYRIGLESYVRWLETTEGTQRSVFRQVGVSCLVMYFFRV